MSVWVTSTGYGFDAFAGGRWNALSDKSLRVERWSGGTRAIGLTRERVVFDPTGLADRPLSLTLGRDNARVIVNIGADGTARVAG